LILSTSDDITENNLFFSRFLSQLVIVFDHKLTHIYRRYLKFNLALIDDRSLTSENWRHSRIDYLNFISTKSEKSDDFWKLKLLNEVTYFKDEETNVSSLNDIENIEIVSAELTYLWLCLSCILNQAENWRYILNEVFLEWMQEPSCKFNYSILSCSVFEIKRPKLISAVCVSLEFIFSLCVSSELATSLWEIWLRLFSQSVLLFSLHQSSKKYHEPWTTRTSLTVSASVIIRNTYRNTSNAFLSL